ncbi:putative ubiquitin carboxyl-terminal hydrolase MINDY-4 [Saccoglossus kowalevskii]|uniref:Ubiquitin carboxyl-terminal hydrolase MINDY n=1 Tax=Saccoglossus kowalevskii TaxID=10224 RepID=A0ABM0M975_SACKO|nr:PREDICTED: protein FAM188B-like [Saccoglossus kowalevskii]
MDHASVESLTGSLVREYLSRKGLKNTLDTMDKEFPRTRDSISNRVQLAKELNIEKLLKRNKEQEMPLRTMLEVIAKHLLDKRVNKSSSASNLSESTVKEQRPSSSKGNRSASGKSPKTGTWDLDGDMEVMDLGGLPQSNLGPTGRTASIKKSSSSSRYVSKPDPEPVTDRTDFHRPSDLIEDIETDYNNYKPKNIIRDPPKMEYTAKEETLPASKTNARPTTASNRHRGMSGPISSSRDDVGRRRGPKKTSNITPGLGSMLEFYPLDTASDKIVDEDKPEMNILETPAAYNKVDRNKDNAISKLVNDNQVVNNKLEQKSVVEEKKRPKSSSSQKPKAVHGDMELGDVDDLETDLGDLTLGPVPSAQLRNIVDAKPITLQQAMELKNLMFGSPSVSFSPEWRNQGFGFSNKPRLEYGMVQHKGGPCGVLASVQACMLQHLLFGKDKVPSTASLEPTNHERSTCLAHAITDILWRAGEKKQAILALPSGRSIFSGGGRYKPDHLTETLVLNSFTKYDELSDFVRANVGVFEGDQCGGVILLLYSALLSRTIDNVIGDMDEPTNKLMGMHGYCTQEMVNLILTGKAVSNVFNDVMEIGSGEGTEKMILKGIKSRSDIGLLSLFEHYGSCEVGVNFKTPRYPIWVVCSESHFSVLFCLKKELISDWRMERRFDLYYYDGLSRQEEEIRLTVDTTVSYTPPYDEELVPPLDHCIRTKWKDSVIDWNGIEPIL